MFEAPIPKSSSSSSSFSSSAVFPVALAKYRKDASILVAFCQRHITASIINRRRERFETQTLE
jgi:hypothetical protein